MQNKHTALRALLWIICVYHIAFGLLANLPSETVRNLAHALFGLNLPEVSALEYVLKPFGIYVMTFGVMMGVAAWNPVKNRALISVGVVLFGLRILQRLISMAAMEHALSITPARNLGTLAVVAAFGLALAWLRLQLYREMHAPGTPEAAS